MLTLTGFWCQWPRVLRVKSTRYDKDFQFFLWQPNLGSTFLWTLVLLHKPLGFLDPRSEEGVNWWQECCPLWHWRLHCVEEKQSFGPGERAWAKLLVFWAMLDIFGWQWIYAFSNSNICLGVDCVAPGDYCDPLPWELLRTLAQLGAPCRCSCCCGFLPGFLFKVFLKTDI